ncbi:MAG: hypothetical protein ACU836_17165 [Gammaproteobacteria bacterium]
MVGLVCRQNDFRNPPRGATGEKVRALNIGNSLKLIDKFLTSGVFSRNEAAFFCGKKSTCAELPRLLLVQQGCCAFRVRTRCFAFNHIKFGLDHGNLEFSLSIGGFERQLKYCAIVVIFNYDYAEF